MKLPELIDPDTITHAVDAHIVDRHDPGVRHRAAIEVAIVRQLLTSLKEDGYEIFAENGEDKPIEQSIDQMMETLFAVDEANILVNTSLGRNQFIFLVFGNDGWDVISDYTMALEIPFMEEFSEWVEKQQAHDEARIAMKEDVIVNDSTLHKHKCPKCGHIWEHDESCFNNEEKHKCEKCGTTQFYKHLEGEHCAALANPYGPRFSRNFFTALMEMLWTESTTQSKNEKSDCNLQ